MRRLTWPQPVWYSQSEWFSYSVSLVSAYCVTTMPIARPLPPPFPRRLRLSVCCKHRRKSVASLCRPHPLCHAIYACQIAPRRRDPSGYFWPRTLYRLLFTYNECPMYILVLSANIIALCSSACWTFAIICPVLCSRTEFHIVLSDFFDVLYLSFHDYYCYYTRLTVTFPGQPA